MANVLGLIGDTLGIYSFLAGLFANKGNNGAVVRISAGLNGGGLSAADGNIESIRNYNLNQQLIGNRAGGYVGSGGFADYFISQPNTQQAYFTQIYASDNAVCIPYATTTWVDGAHYGWTGDFGYACGLSWYYGNVVVDGGNSKPRCTWIDKDGTNGISAAMLMIAWPSFVDKKVEGNNANDYCGYPAFRAYRANGGVVVKRDEFQGPVKRATPDTRIVVTSEPSHNATALCGSATSVGPDLVSLYEKVYCNMETRETLPLCGGDIAEDCFDVAAKQVHKQNGKRDEPKAYAEVIEWAE